MISMMQKYLESNGIDVLKKENACTMSLVYRMLHPQTTSVLSKAKVKIKLDIGR
jgi:hypothetical protein